MAPSLLTTPSQALALAPGAAASRVGGGGGGSARVSFCAALCGSDSSRTRLR